MVQTETRLTKEIIRLDSRKDFDNTREHLRIDTPVYTFELLRLKLVKTLNELE